MLISGCFLENIYASSIFVCSTLLLRPIDLLVDYDTFVAKMLMIDKVSDARSYLIKRYLRCTDDTLELEA